MSTRTRSFIETCVKFEKEARQQVKLASLCLHLNHAALLHFLDMNAANTFTPIPQSSSAEEGVQVQVESLELARDSAAANHKRELAAAQRDAAQVAAQHKSAAASWHTDLDWHKSEVRPSILL